MLVFLPAMPSLLRRQAAVALASVLLLPVATAADQWLKLTSSHFELYTTAGEKKGREALLYFEQVRDFFSRTRAGSQPLPSAPVRIIAFRSEKEFAPYRINEFSTAFYQNGYGHDYIVMRSITEENYPVAVHEYTHLLIRHTGVEIPPWLNEGLAELYSTLKPYGNKVAIGHVIPGRYLLLQQNKWLPLETLVAVDHKSPYYNERNRASIFYAESWALVHMLILSPSYAPLKDKFLALIGSGIDAANAFWQGYAKTTTQVQKDLEQYMRGTRFNAAVFDVKLEKSADEPDVVPASPLEAGTALAELLTLTRKHEEAKQAYESLAKEYPKSWEPEAGLAELAWRTKRAHEALPHFARAVELGSTSPQVFYDYSRVAQTTKEKIPLAKKALELDPEYQEARRYLAFCLVEDGQYQEAVDQLLQVKALKAAQAFSYYHELAYASFKLENLEDAQKAAERARCFARRPEDDATAENLLGKIASERERRASLTRPPREPAPPTGTPDDARIAERPVIRRTEPRDQPSKGGARSDPELPPKAGIHGVLHQIDCLGKVARLRVLADGKLVTLAITDPQMVTVKGTPTGRMDLTCGPQKPKSVVLEYESRADKELGTAGVIKSIEFQ